MYNELYDVWKREVESDELGKLPPDFYANVAEYLRKLREEGRMLDKRTVKASLLNMETQNVKRMLREVIQVRYRKLVKKVARGEEVQSELLTAEEERIRQSVLPFAEAFRNFAKETLRGHASKVSLEQERERLVLRFLKDVPAIVGADMKMYGPFKVEDVASLPIGNAKILVKQGLAEKVEVT